MVYDSEPLFQPEKASLIETTAGFLLNQSLASTHLVEDPEARGELMEVIAALVDSSE